MKGEVILEEKLSISGNIISYDSQTLDVGIEDILSSRFDDISVLEKNIQDLHDPYLLRDMRKAVDRIKTAKENQEKVIIFGDYDVDGVTSTSLLMHLFKTLDMLVSYRLPHRVHD